MISRCCHLSWLYDGSGSTGNGGVVLNIPCLEMANWDLNNKIEKMKMK